MPSVEASDPTPTDQDILDILNHECDHPLISTSWNRTNEFDSKFVCSTTHSVDDAVGNKRKNDTDMEIPLPLSVEINSLAMKRRRLFLSSNKNIRENT